jgi:hypothetical protein
MKFILARPFLKLWTVAWCCSTDFAESIKSRPANMMLLGCHCCASVDVVNWTISITQEIDARCHYYVHKRYLEQRRGNSKSNNFGQEMAF